MLHADLSSLGLVAAGNNLNAVINRARGPEMLKRLEPLEIKVYLPVADNALYGVVKEKDPPENFQKNYAKRMCGLALLAIGSSDTIKHLRHCDPSANLSAVVDALQN